MSVNIWKKKNINHSFSHIKSLSHIKDKSKNVFKLITLFIVRPIKNFTIFNQTNINKDKDKDKDFFNFNNKDNFNLNKDKDNFNQTNLTKDTKIDTLISKVFLLQLLIK